MTDANDHLCSVCAEPLERGQQCASDIDLGICHWECLEGSPVVDLRTGEPYAGEVHTFSYDGVQ